MAMVPVHKCEPRLLSSLAPSCSPSAEHLACARSERCAPHHERRLAPETELGEPHRGAERGGCQHERDVGDCDEWCGGQQQRGGAEHGTGKAGYPHESCTPRGGLSMQHVPSAYVVASATTHSGSSLRGWFTRVLTNRPGSDRRRRGALRGRGMGRGQTYPAGSRITPSSQEIRLRNTPTNSRGDPTRECEKQQGERTEHQGVLTIVEVDFTVGQRRLGERNQVIDICGRERPTTKP